MVHPHLRTVLSRKKRRTTGTHSNLDDVSGNYAQRLHFIIAFNNPVFPSLENFQNDKIIEFAVQK